MTLTVLVVLALGTFAFRLAGVVLNDRLVLTEPVRRAVSVSAIALIFALAVQSAVAEGTAFAGYARLGGVVVGAVLVWRRASFLTVVVAAVATTALLRFLGVA
ncbi:AzlD domain-containing protein [Streptomyces clavuligerus]|uniref:Membrane protein n=1 Tax=Streptomyces clavuligerus TaxID=1901 RepID=B5GMQ0_STRCL|nr:AzlD domain-containing protein [Streptomyces clavuligerus]ACJ02374.1 membrane protein [Streptomyces clavuligerus]ANW22445.1 branched-chain amino acid transporter [Streptomyces clavuligerus]AXU17350.1 AzlD domain-containing protein [Streptomyces clavuligerus]EDY47596.1 hypothetical protein SSCG_00624 [Streptomyces clavuligerus]EFG04554.1 Hypothetical protein SCLAV_p1068 [Streptomyces clavuligerus]